MWLRGHKRINSVGVISKAWLPTLPHTRGSFYSLFAIEPRLNSSDWNSKQPTIWLPPRPPTAPPPAAARHQQPWTILGTQRAGLIAGLTYFHPHQCSSFPPPSLFTTDPSLQPLGPCPPVLCEACSNHCSPHPSLPFRNSYSSTRLAVPRERARL